LTVPPAIADMGEEAAEAFVDFFTAEIRNKNTRAAYGRAAAGFLAWCDAGGVTLPEVRTVHVSAYVEELGDHLAPASVKQHLAALRMLGDYLTRRQVLRGNPADAVRGPKHVVRTGKTPVMEAADAKRLLESIDTDTAAGVRDKAIIAMMIFTFARVSAVMNLNAGDVYQVGRHLKVMYREKGGQQHEMPLHHSAVEAVDAYLERLGHPKEGPLFRTIARTRDGYTDSRMSRSDALQMVKRRCRRAGIGDRFNCHTFRATGITVYLKNGGQLEHAQHMAGHAKPETTKLYDRRQQETTLDEVERIIL
jgi:site-specific recombinase XerD